MSDVPAPPAVAPFVTLSASYGTGGSEIGPEVARRLEVSFYDRAIPREVARRLAVPLEAALAHEEQPSGPIGRLLASFAPLGALYGAAHLAPEPTVVDARTYRAAADRVIHELAQQGGGVLLGRAGAFVLREDPRALHVRLDGPPAARTAAAARRQGIDRSQADDERRQTDGARDAYAKGLYGFDARDPKHYHLVLDSTALPLEDCAQLIVMAARSRLQTQGAGG